MSLPFALAIFYAGFSTYSVKLGRYSQFARIIPPVTLFILDQLAIKIPDETLYTFVLGIDPASLLFALLTKIQRYNPLHHLMLIQECDGTFHYKLLPVVPATSSVTFEFPKNLPYLPRQ